MIAALTPALMTIYFFVNQSRKPLQTFKAAASLWRQDKWKPIVSSICNLAMSFSAVLLLPEAYKLDGVIAATIISFALVELPWESRVVFGEFFDSALARIYWRKHAVFALFTALACAAAYAAASAIEARGLAALALKGAAAAFVAGSILVAAFWKDVLGLAAKLKKHNRNNGL